MGYADEQSHFDDPVDLYLTSLGNLRSRQTMTHALKSFARFISEDFQATAESVQWSRIKYKDIQNFLAHLSDAEYKENTQSLYLSAIKGVLRKAATISTVDPDKRVKHEVLIEITEQITPPVVSGKKQLVYVPYHDMKAILDTCDNSPAGRRDKAILLLMYGCGLRRSEVVSLNTPKSVNWVQQHLVVIGKKNKRREIPLFKEIEDAIIDWLEEDRGESSGPLFYPLSKSGRLLQTSALTHYGIGDIVTRRCQKAHTETYRPHDFRGTFATTLFELETDLFTIMELMGHDDPNTTRRYDLRNAVAGHDAMAKISQILKKDA